MLTSAVPLDKARVHYDAYPYDVDVRDSKVYSSERSPVGRFLTRISGGLALDLGCGTGNLLSALAARSRLTIGLDVSRTSLGLAATATKTEKVSLVEGTALSLPFGDQIFDIVVAAGSLHHTPNAAAAFAEGCRVLRPGGQAFVAVYRSHSYYSLMYATLGSLARSCERSPVLRVLVNRFLLVPVFVLYIVAGRLVIHRQLSVPSYTQATNYFADQLLNPVVSFQATSEVAAWAQTAGVDILRSSTSHAGALLNFELRRPEQVAEP